MVITRQSRDKFIVACTLGTIGDIEKILEDCPDISSDSKFIKQVAFEACQRDDFLVIEWMLSKYSYLDAYIGRNQTFSQAAYNGNLKLAKWLLARYPYIDLYKNNRTLLKECCYNGFLEFAQWLIDIEPDLKKYLAEKMFLECCYSGNIKIAEWMKPMVKNASDE